MKVKASDTGEFIKDAHLSHKNMFSGQNDEEMLLNQKDPSIGKPQKCMSFCPPVQADCIAVQLYNRAVTIPCCPKLVGNKEMLFRSSGLSQF